MIEKPEPFNQGEIEVQNKLGVHQKVMSYAHKMIRGFMPEQHQLFYSQLPLLFVGSVDQQGRPWASAVFGEPGFIQSPDPKTLSVHTRPSYGDPLNDNLELGASLGFLGLEHHTRRRNRLNGKLSGNHKEGFEIAVDQTFGNCPRFIHARIFDVTEQVKHQGDARPLRRMKQLNERARNIIDEAGSFFIASYFQEDPKETNQGADVSHRGGKPGFVRILDDRTLIYPEFAGNNHYNTMGNLHKNPLAGLLFLDFQSGDILYLTCATEIIWDDPAIADFEGAKQFIRLVVDEAIHVEGVMPLRWQSLDNATKYSKIGTWQEADNNRRQRQELGSMK